MQTIILKINSVFKNQYNMAKHNITVLKCVNICLNLKVKSTKLAYLVGKQSSSTVGVTWKLNPGLLYENLVRDLQLYPTWTLKKTFFLFILHSSSFPTINIAPR